MKLLEEKILKEGKYLGNGILKVDSFMNHQIDPALMKEIGKELAGHFKDLKPTRILTAESSGIAPALITAIELGVPLVYARKSKPITMKDPYIEKSESHTYKKAVELNVSAEYLHSDDRVLIIDDFLATARTILSLVALIEQSGASIVGIGSVIEKVFEGGREKLSHLGLPIVSLARISSFDNDQVNFAES
ncbi:MAG: xanthine phosphoribosyltransferase [Candidatus Obscuribacterales bacterium]|jgi:xanthine phosphoribosyltransferase|nr:xanthine phosphoribosyltransferase [Candidatus Obscuribacterales bacterium]